MNSFFESAYALEHAAHDALVKATTEYPILAFPGLELRKRAAEYADMPLDDLQKELIGTIDGKGVEDGILDNIHKTREQLNATNVWELVPVIVMAKRRMGITGGSPQDLLIQEAMQKAADDKFWRDLALSALGLGLGLLALAGGPVGWAALAGGIAVGAVDAYHQYEELTFHEAASQSAMDPKKALSDVDPNWVWFAISLIGLGLDIGDAVKVVKAVRTVVKGTKAIRSSDDFIESTVEVLDSEKRALQKNLDAATDKDEVVELTAKLNKLEEAEKGVKGETFRQRADLLALVGDEADVFYTLSQVLSSDAIVVALTKIQSKLPADRFLYILRFYGGTGQPWVHQLPEVVEVALKGKLDEVSEDLFEQVLTHPRVQRVLLDHAREPGLLGNAWQKWKNYLEQPDNAQLMFHEYLSQGLKYKTALTPSGETLLDVFGRSFATLVPRVKNLKVLRTTEPGLADAIQAGDVLPEMVQKAIDDVLKEDLIRSATYLPSARRRVVKAINRAIGDNSTIGELRRISDEIVSQPASKGSIFEHWVRNNFESLGKTHVRLADRTRVLIDNHVIRDNRAVFVEIKNIPGKLGSHDLKQLDNYEKLLSKKVRFRSQAEELLPIRFQYIFSNEQAALDNASTIYGKLDKRRVTVHFIDDTGALAKVP